MKPSITSLFLPLLLFLYFHCQLCSASISSKTFFPAGSSSSLKSRILPIRTQNIPTGSFPRPAHKVPFHHNISLTVSLQVGTPPQNVTMVIDTGSELSWLSCNQTRPNQLTFNTSSSRSYSNISCSSPTCTTRTRDFTIPVSCDSVNGNLCHAMLSYADMSSAEGNLAEDKFTFGTAADMEKEAVFGCMFSGFDSNPEADANTTGLMGMNRGGLSFVTQLEFKKFSYCISGSDFLGVLLLGDANFTWLAPLNYTPLVQISDPLPYFNRVAYTVHFEGIMVAQKLLQLEQSIFRPDHTGAGQTMVDSGTQFSFLLGPVYTALRSEYDNQVKGLLQPLNEPNFVFQGGMDLCYRIPANQSRLPLELPSVTLMFRGAAMRVEGNKLLYRIPGALRGTDAVYCFTFGNSDLLGVEAYVIGHHHQQNVWMEFDLEKSRIGLASVQCDLAVQSSGLQV